MRLAYYTGASTALAAGVVISAFHQRANFYSAMVYLFQSNLCLMILVNLSLLAYSFFVYGLQRVCFGQLRAVEVEQLYERAWFAVTETCLAMTIFRDEVGGFFIVMFVALLTGKVWGWIGEGRIEALEQQPPANPRLFHTRLSISLLLSLVYDLSLLRYAVQTVIQVARPDMMVMFLFEFAVLSFTSLHSTMRYLIVLLDSSIVKKQTRVRLEARRRAVREEREDILRRRAEGEEDDGEPLPDEEDVDEMDIEVPGWEAKGQYILCLDLWTDFVKLCLYAAFFFVLMTFYGLPLHIIRDLFLTVRSFVRRLGALMKYRQAMREVNKYPDATEEDLARENTCIICREDMHVWNPTDLTTVERSRPKKLPCGHILHLGCLKSWMERQQVCPTCRRSVVVTAAPPPRNEAVMLRIGLNIPGRVGGVGAGGEGAGAGAVANAAQNAGVPAPGAAGQPPAGQAAAGAQQAVAGNNNGRGGVRMFNLGPLRFGFAQGGMQDIQQMAQRMGVPAAMAGGNIGGNAAAAAAAVPAAAPLPAQAPVPAAAAIPAAGVGLGMPLDPTLPAMVPDGNAFPASLFSRPVSLAPEAILADLRAIERRIEMAVNAMQSAGAETQQIRRMLAELQRLRQTQAAARGTPGASAPAPPQAAAAGSTTQSPPQVPLPGQAQGPASAASAASASLPDSQPSQTVPSPAMANPQAAPPNPVLGNAQAAANPAILGAAANPLLGRQAAPNAVVGGQAVPNLAAAYGGVPAAQAMFGHPQVPGMFGAPQAAQVPANLRAATNPLLGNPQAVQNMLGGPRVVPNPVLGNPQAVLNPTLGRPQPPVGLAGMPQTRANLTQASPAATNPGALRLTSNAATPAIPAGSPNLPAGVQLPAGWSLIPLSRLGNSIVVHASPGVRPASQQNGQSSSQATGSGSSTGEGDASMPTATAASPEAKAKAAEVTTQNGAETKPQAIPNWGGSAQMFGSAGPSRSSETQTPQQTAGVPAAGAPEGEKAVDGSAESSAD